MMMTTMDGDQARMADGRRISYTDVPIPLTHLADTAVLYGQQRPPLLFVPCYWCAATSYHSSWSSPPVKVPSMLGRALR